MVVSHWESAVMSKPQDLDALESTKIILSNEFSHSIDRLLPMQTCCIFEPSMGFLPQWRLICRLIEINGPQITSNQPRHPRQIKDEKVFSKSILWQWTSPMSIIGENIQKQSKWAQWLNRYLKHRKNCECCHHHSVFKGHNAIVHIVVLNCQECNQCLKCQVSGHKKIPKIWKLFKNLKTFKKSENF